MKLHGGGLMSSDSSHRPTPEMWHLHQMQHYPDLLLIGYINRSSISVPSVINGVVRVFIVRLLSTFIRSRVGSSYGGLFSAARKRTLERRQYRVYSAAL
jgi:hypothetical protein